jgi:uncharacterized repeat protein (TIGR04052 family)
MKALLCALHLIAGLIALAGGQRTFHIKFVAVVGEQPFTCGVAYHGLGTTHATVTPEFLRLYVSGVALIDTAGKEVPLKLDQDGTWQQRDVAFLSFEGSNQACASGSPQERQTISGTAPDGRYVGIRFIVGMPQSLDHADATIAASPLNLSDMFWSWQDGYKFFRFDARIVGKAGQASAFVFHLGSTGCRGSDARTTCAQPNEATIRLRGFDGSQTIVLDVARLLQSADLERGGCMMMRDDVCSPELRALGLTGAAQSVFRVR